MNHSNIVIQYIVTIWNIVSEKEKIKYNNIIKRYKNDQIPNWSLISDHLYRILIVGGSESGETYTLLNLINHEPDIDNFFYMLKILMKQNISC